MTAATKTAGEASDCSVPDCRQRDAAPVKPDGASTRLVCRSHAEDYLKVKL